MPFGSALYRADAVERAALALGLKADDWYNLAKQAYGAGDMTVFEKAAARTLELLTQIDRLMEAHPYHRLERWIDFARAHGDTPELKQAYESNARCIVTYWTAGVQNYSARVWGGLVRDYYREWIRLEFDSMRNGTPFDENQFMIDYTKGTGTSPFTACADPIADAKTWLKHAMEEKLPVVEKIVISGTEEFGQWSPAQITSDWKAIEWNIPADKLAKMSGVLFTFTGGNHRLEIQSVAVVADGKIVAEDKHFGYAGKPDGRNIYKLSVPAGTTGNNGSVIRAVVKGGGGTNSNGVVGWIKK